MKVLSHNICSISRMRPEQFHRFPVSVQWVSAGDGRDDAMRLSAVALNQSKSS